jgi:hypothetical protein
VSTNIALSLSDRIGVIALANADDKDSPISDIIVAVAQKAFNTTTSSVSSTDEQPTSTAPPTKRRWIADVTARSNTTSVLSPLFLEGTYYDAGYGSILLCSVLSSSPPCQSVLADFHSVDNSLSPNSTDLFVPWNGVTDKHIRFAHTNDSQYSYSMSIGTVYPEGYGKNSTPFSDMISYATTEFVVENNTVVGFGISGIDGVKRVGPVEEASDVWFVKVA